MFEPVLDSININKLNTGLLIGNVCLHKRYSFSTRSMIQNRVMLACLNKLCVFLLQLLVGGLMVINGE